MKYSLGSRFLANETKQSCCTFVEQVLESLVAPIEILEHRQDPSYRLSLSVEKGSISAKRTARTILKFDRNLMTSSLEESFDRIQE